MNKIMSILLGAAILLCGCATSVVDPIPYSGFLGTYYSQLQPATSPSGQPVMRWISPRLQQGNYKQVVITPSQFYPQPKTSDQLYTDTLQQVLNYIDTGLYQHLSAVTTVVQPGLPNITLNNTLRIQLAVSGVAATGKGLQLFKEQTFINVEYKVTDALTNEVLAVGVRKGFGKLMPTTDAITLDDLAPVLDGWAQDAASFFVAIKK